MRGGGRAGGRPHPRGADPNLGAGRGCQLGWVENAAGLRLNNAASVRFSSPLIHNREFLDAY